jgi:hypothetical protein
MNTTLLNALKEIVSQHGGVETLSDARRVKALLSDLASTEPRPQKNALIACIELGFVSLLQNVPAGEQDTAKARLAERLNREEGLDPALCADALDLLEAALMDNTDTQPEEQNAVPSPVPPSSAPAAEESDDSFNGSGEKNAEIAGMAVDIERLTEERNRSNYENRKIKESLKKMKFGLIVAIIGIVISIGVGYSQYSSLESDLWYANYSKNQLQTNHDALMREFEASKRLWAVNVTAIKAGNWGNDRWLISPGGVLFSSQMRYLNPVITYNASFNGEATFYIKIIDPNGNLFHNANISPAGYTCSSTGRINRGNNQTLVLTGWGSSDSSTYWAGAWTVEVWYNDVCLRSEKVGIN